MLSRDDLANLGVTTVGHRLQLLRAISELPLARPGPNAPAPHAQHPGGGAARELRFERLATPPPTTADSLDLATEDGDDVTDVAKAPAADARSGHSQRPFPQGGATIGEPMGQAAAAPPPPSPPPPFHRLHQSLKAPLDHSPTAARRSHSRTPSL